MSQQQNSSGQSSAIYDRFRSSDRQIELLMSDKGEAYLDSETVKMMKDMDVEEIIEFSSQFFKFGQNQCSSLQALVSNQLTSRINLEGGSANVPETVSQINRRQAFIKQTRNVRNQRKNTPSNIKTALPQLFKQMNIIRQAIQGNDQIGAISQRKQSDASDGDRINFEQFSLDQYRPQLAQDEDYLAEDLNEYGLTQATNLSQIKKQTETFSKPNQTQPISHSSYDNQQQNDALPHSQYPTTIQEDAQLDFDQIQRIQLPQNRFKITYNNGDSYEGELQNQMKNGWGQYYYSTGQKYSGNFIDDQIHGYGRYFFLSGAQYEGDWSSGLKHGIGILKFGNGDQYEGQFVNDLFHGKGTYKSANGDIFKGNWKSGLKHGKGTFQGVDGSIQIGHWVNDKFQV